MVTQPASERERTGQRWLQNDRYTHKGQGLQYKWLSKGMKAIDGGKYHGIA